MSSCSSDYEGNQTPESPADLWLQRSFFEPWADASRSPVTVVQEDNGRQRDTDPDCSRDGARTTAPYRHVPHRERPPLLVARRNARERRRVQAVNTAFTRLRKAVPIVNAKGKRVSKVKTLLTAIDYIQGLQTLLKQSDLYHQDYDIIMNYKYQADNFIDILAEFD